MKKNQVKDVIIYPSASPDTCSLANKISEFHYDLIERKLEHSSLPTEQKIEIIINILNALKNE
ncbi:hypothetical protein [Wansuia hejianensis]|uniref:Uncharacterized protein n=1 Tax=Wansuia hejianensis TaxID=2763667 RepID=A0A7G9GEV3_9FIRM|nr:hypothetical protein [Wansuia hejianensis]QNM09335.1 hypothetical protein H9Q79_03335 [Wansuia hejianensis]RHV88595.1 hypothetical protein DXA96_10740 [Lachnospiraceae bacterium OF09-33XD]